MSRSTLNENFSLRYGLCRCSVAIKEKELFRFGPTSRFRAPTPPLTIHDTNKLKGSTSDDYPPEPIHRRPRRQRSLRGPTAGPDERAVSRGVLLARHAVGYPGNPRRQHHRRRPVTDPRAGRTTRTLPQRI